jgi:hypothetical protein
MPGDVPREIKITNATIEALRKLGAWCFKVHGGPMQEIGLPDIVGVFRGRGFGLEVKSPGKEKSLTPRQALHIREIKRAGGISGVISAPEQATALLLKEATDGQREVTQ